MEWEPKPDSPAARIDQEQYDLRRIAKDLAANEPPRRSPTPQPKYVTDGELGKLLERIGRLVGKAIRESCERLEKRVAELEQREWVGVWQQGKSYKKNALVSHDGSCWCAMRDHPEHKPGVEGSGWRLIVKKGRDAR